MQSILYAISAGGWSTLIGIGLLRITRGEDSVGDERWLLIAWMLLAVGIMSYIGLLLRGAVTLIQLVPSFGDPFCAKFEHICEAIMPLN